MTVPIPTIYFSMEITYRLWEAIPLQEARMHLQRIKDWGYTTIRYLITWEAMEHAGPGKYDREFVNYTIEVLKIIEEVGGLYVFLNFIKMFGHGILEAVEHVDLFMLLD